MAPGFSGRLTQKPYAGFSLDVQAMVIFGITPGKVQWGIAPELGYSLRVPTAEHQLTVGLGVVYGVTVEVHNFAWIPRLVLSWDREVRNPGVRNGIVWDFAENGFAVEVSHQVLFVDGKAIHDVRAAVSIDLLMLSIVLRSIFSRVRRVVTPRWL